MSRRRAGLAAAALAALLCGTATATAATTTPAHHGSLTTHRYTAPGGLTRSYLLYVPPGARPGQPVVEFLHGCNQTADQARIASRFDDLADRRGFTVVYPEQVIPTALSAPVVDGNGIGCWNWFLPEDQARDSGEPAVLAGIAEQVAHQRRADRSRVFVEGISAGADMSVILATTYPDVFAAAGSIAGCAYRACSDVTGELTHQAMGTHAREVPLFVENGTADTLNPAALSLGLTLSWLGADDLADNGQLDGSVPRTPASVQTSQPGTPAPGSGDPCVHNDSWTCPGGVLGLKDYPVTVARYDDARGREVLQLWLVHGMEHAQPHAPSGQPYTDPLGPDVTTASYDFFLRAATALGGHAG